MSQEKNGETSTTTTNPPVKPAYEKESPDSAAASAEAGIKPKKAKAQLKNLLILSLVLLVMGGAYFFTAKKVNKKVLFKNPAIADLADSQVEISEDAESQDLLTSVLPEEQFFKIQEKNYLLKPGEDIRFAKATFILQAKTSEDIDLLEKNQELVLETLNNLMRTLSLKDFEGIEGKQAMREKIVRTLNDKLPAPVVVNLRYGSLMFH